jgi:hypothetical protein
MADKGAEAVVDEEKAKKKKQMIMGGGLLGLAALILFWQYGPSILGETDPEVKLHPEVKVVVDAEKKADTQQLASLAKSKDDWVAMRAASSLAAAAGPEAVRDYASDRRPQMRHAVLAGLSATPDASRLPALQQFTADPDTTVRMAAVSSIAQIDDFKIFDHLIPMLNDPDSNVRRSAQGAIESRIGMGFPDYKADGNPGERARGIAKIRQQVSKMKEIFDRSVAFEKQRNTRGARR